MFVLHTAAWVQGGVPRVIFYCRLCCLDLTLRKQPVLSLNVYILYSKLSCLWTCTFESNLCCPWTCLSHSSLRCPWKCLSYSKPCCLDWSFLHQPVLSSPRKCLCWAQIAACAAFVRVCPPADCAALGCFWPTAVFVVSVCVYCISFSTFAASGPQSRQSAKRFSSRCNWDSPTLSPQASMPPTLWSGWDGTLACG
jgi:hypothetical protein